jgi:hypothetical protein
MKSKKILQLINLMDEPNRSSCLKIFNDNIKRFIQSPGSLTKHQAWKGGYIDHLEEAMNFGIELFTQMNKKRKLDFCISDVLLVLFLHDLEKPFRYTDPKIEFVTDVDKKIFINSLIKKYKVKLSKNHINALKYVHGEGDEYNRTKRLQKPLAAFVHICDIVSARIWFAFPEK